ncbi:HD domain-containing protein [bacterium]|nr:HD domain-containing protein [bacterium]
MASRFSDLIILISGGINQRRLYFDDHPRVREQARAIILRFEDVLQQTGETGFFFGIHKGKFVRNGKFMVGPSIAGRNLIELARQLACGGFLLRRGLTEDELLAFFRLGAVLNAPVNSLQAAKDLFLREGIGHIDPAPHFQETAAPAGSHEAATIDPGLITFDFEDGPAGGPPPSLQKELEPLLPLFQTMFSAVESNTVEAARDQSLDLDRNLDAGQELVGRIDPQTIDIMNLMRYPDYDSFTVGHGVRMATLSVTVGRGLGWPAHLLTELAAAAMLHDVGKAKIPADILYKPGALTDEERRVAESHAEIGARMLLAQGCARPAIIAGAWGHHLRHDGAGYPVTPDWIRRSPTAAVLKVCDVFEALTAARPYKAPLSPRRAFEIMIGDAGAFDPRILTTLFATIGLHPPGSRVELSDGSRGYVRESGRNQDRPLVLVTTAPDGRDLEINDQFLVDLAEETNLEVADFQSVAMESCMAEDF